MHSTRFFHCLVGATLLGATGYADLAKAHVKTGALKKRADASDIYQVTCTDPGRGIPPRLDAQISDLLPAKPPLLTVYVEKDSVGVTSTDPKDGDGLFSPLVSLNGGAGTYTVTVSKLPKPGKADKTRRHAETYRLDYHCITGTEHTDTKPILTIQNQ